MHSRDLASSRFPIVRETTMKSDPSFTKLLFNLTGSLDRMNGQSVLRSIEST